MTRRTRQQNGCPAPPGACSHPTICAMIGCAALEARRNREREAASRRRTEARDRIIANLSAWLDSLGYEAPLPDDVVVMEGSALGDAKSWKITAGDIREARRERNG